MTVAAVPSIRATLRHRTFRALIAGGTVYFIGNAMQAMAASWLMVEMTGSSFLAALVQTAVFLPMFLLSLPSGVMADTTDRRRLILGALGVQAAVVALMAVLFLVGWAGPTTLLLLTFVAGCCTAMLSPPWNSAIVDAVPRDELAAGDHRGRHRLQHRARARAGDRRRGPTPPPAAARCSCSRCSASSRCWRRSAATRPARTCRRGCPLPERLWGGDAQRAALRPPLAHGARAASSASSHTAPPASALARRCCR